MRKTALSIFSAVFGACVLVSGCAVNQTSPSANVQPSAPAVGYEFPHVKRPNLVVSDIDRALTIYRDVLGLTAGDIGTSSPTSYSYPVFKIPREATIRFTTLSEPGERRVFGLTEVTGVDLPTPHDGPHMSTVVIGVADLPGKIAQLEAMGLETVEPRKAGGAEFRFVEQAFVDYDGHLIVLYEPLGSE